SRRHRCGGLASEAQYRAATRAIIRRDFVALENGKPPAVIGSHDMKYEVRISDKTYVVECEHHSEGWQATLVNESKAADVVEIAPNTFSVLMEGQSHEICVTPSDDGKLKLQTGRSEFAGEVFDPRSWRGRRHGSSEAEGRQQIVAPMPGKVVRVLV